MVGLWEGEGQGEERSRGGRGRGQAVGGWWTLIGAAHSPVHGDGRLVCVVEFDKAEDEVGARILAGFDALHTDGLEALALVTAKDVGDFALGGVGGKALYVEGG